MKTHRSIKWLFALFILILIRPLCNAQINTPATATVPFGSKIAASASPYAYGIVPTNLPTGSYTPASNLYGKSQDAYSAYNTSMTSNSICASITQVTSNAIAITVNPNPPFDTNVSGPSSVTSNQTGVTYSVTDQPGMTYTWSVPAGSTIVSGQGTNSIVVDFGSSSGDVTLVETNPVGQTSTITLAVTVGTATAVLVSSTESVVKVYPVPCSEKITIDLRESITAVVSYTLVDAQGNIVLINTINYSGTPVNIEMPFAQGMYELIITWNEHKAIQKIIKQ